MAHALGARYEETLTGFKWIANRALELSQKEGLRFVMGYEEALGYCCGRAVRDKDGLSAALLFTEMAAWLRHGGRTVTGYLEEIYRRFGFYLSALSTITESGPGSAERLKALMDRLRQRPPAELGDGPGGRVVETSDLLSGERRRADGTVERLSYPSSDVLVYRLGDGSRITVRPSGTEPKVKFYFEVKQPAEGAEAMSEVEARARGRLDALVKRFMTELRS
jgi:phosphomannomutase